MFPNSHHLFSFRYLAGLCLLSALSTHAAVEPYRSDAPVHIEADRMTYNMKEGVSRYYGNVKVTQEQTVLTGDQVVVLQKDNRIKYIEVTGTPARYTQPGEGGDVITAESRKMNYNAENSRLVLTGDAQVQQPGQSIKSQKITYDTENKVVVAGENKPDERVNITITPNRKDPP